MSCNEETCNECNLGKHAQNPCLFGEGNKGAKVMLVANSPTDKENITEKPFSSKSAMNLLKSLAKRGITRDDIYCTYAIKCPAEEGKKLTPKHVTACKQYIDAEIEVINPDIIVPLGNEALKAVINKTGITTYRGRALEHEGRIIFPMLHPNTISRNPSNRPIILDDLNTLADIYTNGMPKVGSVGYVTVDTWKQAIEVMDKLEEECLSGDPDLEWLSFDIESTGNNPWAKNAAVVCINLCNKERTGYTIPLYHHESTIVADGRGTVIKRLRKLLENPSIKKVAQNGKFDIKYLQIVMDIFVKNFLFDTMLAHYICISEEQGTQGLKSMAWEFTDMGGYDNELDAYKETLPESERNNYDNIPWAILSPYGAADADCTLRLLHIFNPMLDANPKWRKAFDEVMIPGSNALMEVEINGMMMNSEELIKDYQQAYNEELKRITDILNNYPEVVEMEREKQELYAQRQALLKSVPAKERTEEQKDFIKKTVKYKEFKFNWASVTQLQELFFERLGLHTEIRTDTGALSTGEEAMEEIALQHPIANQLLEFRKINTLNNMFIQKIPEMVDKNNIIHPSFLLTGTVTSRLASKDPNVQQIPRKAENPTLFQYHREPKKMFSSRFTEAYVINMLVDDPDYTMNLAKKMKISTKLEFEDIVAEIVKQSCGCIMNTDYSQLELRIAAVIAQDVASIEAYRQGVDVHRLTASIVWGVPIEEVTDEMRTAAKAVGFGCIYGKGGNTLGIDIYMKPPYNYPEKKAKKMGNKLLEDYMSARPQLKNWLDNTVKLAKKQGYVETMFGFHRRLPNIKSKDNGVRSNAERQAKNTPIQGTGGWMTLLSIVQINKEFAKNNLKSKLVCTVHDSLVLDIFVPELPEVARIVKHAMEHSYEGFFESPVEFLSELEVGKDYGSVFGCELEELDELTTKDKFEEWVNAKTEKKHKKAEDYLRKHCDYTDAQVKEYNKKYGYTA